MKALILAGGFGTRLSSVIGSCPKPMAEIDGKPYLHYLLSYLKNFGVTEVIFSVFFMPEVIKDYFGKEFKDIKITYVKEPEPLGTGGAIYNAINILSLEENILVLNGDNFLHINYADFFQYHRILDENFSIALTMVEDTSQYGSVEINKKTKRITEFNEKGITGKGLINTGSYLINAKFFAALNVPIIFSLEKDFLFPNVDKFKINYLINKEYFIDIGTPKDYQRAQSEIPKLVNSKL